jgi:hypothetical protein
MVDYLEAMRQKNCTTESKERARKVLRDTVAAMAGCVFPFICASVGTRPDGQLTVTIDYGPPETSVSEFDERTMKTHYECSEVYRIEYKLHHADVRNLYMEDPRYWSEQIGRKIMQCCVDDAMGRYKKGKRRPPCPH